jgi:hypothetical protein
MQAISASGLTKGAACSVNKRFATRGWAQRVPWGTCSGRGGASWIAWPASSRSSASTAAPPSAVCSSTRSHGQLDTGRVTEGTNPARERRIREGHGRWHDERRLVAVPLRTCDGASESCGGGGGRRGERRGEGLMARERTLGRWVGLTFWAASSPRLILSGPQVILIF